MILLSVSDSLQVVKSTTDYIEGFKIFAIVIGAIVGILTIYWIIYQRIQVGKNNKEKEKINLNEAKLRKLSIKPKFILENYMYDQMENCLTLKFYVSGGSAQLVNIENIHSNLISISTNNYALKELTEINDWLVLTVSNNSVNKTNIGLFNLSFQLIYKDIDGNKYSQKFVGAYSEGIKPNNPKEII